MRFLGVCLEEFLKLSSIILDLNALQVNLNVLLLLYSESQRIINLNCTSDRIDQKIRKKIEKLILVVIEIDKKYQMKCCIFCLKIAIKNKGSKSTLLELRLNHV